MPSEPMASGPRPAPPGAQSRIAERAWVVVLVAAVAAAVPIWLPRYVPTNDGPQHLLAAHMARHLTEAPWNYSAQFARNPSHAGPVFGDGLLQLLLAVGLAPLVAQKVFLTLWTGALAAAMAYAASWRRPAGALRGAAAMLVVHGLTFAMGFFEFLWSLPLAFLCLGIVLRDPALPLGRAVGLGVALLAVVAAHPFSLFITVGAAGAIVLAARGGSLRLGGAALPALVLAVAMATAHASSGADPQILMWASLPDTAAGIALEPFAGIADSGWAGLAGAAAVVGLALPDLRRAGPATRGLLIAAVACAILTVVLPSSIKGWALVHHRFAPFAWLLLLTASGAVPLRRPRLGGALGAVALAAQLVIVGRAHLAIDAGLREYASAASALPYGRRILPLDFEPQGEAWHRLVRPYLHAWAYLLMERGGMTPYVFASESAHAFRFLDRPQAPTEFLDQNYSCHLNHVAPRSPACDEFRATRLGLYVKRAAGYDAVVTWRAPRNLRPLLEAQGLTLRTASARMALFTR